MKFLIDTTIAIAFLIGFTDSQKGLSQCDSLSYMGYSYSCQTGPENWGKIRGSQICSTGKSQSPVDLPTDQEYSNVYKDLRFVGYNTSIQGKVTNTGYRVVITPTNITSQVRSFVYTNGTYNFKYQLKDIAFIFGSGPNDGTEHTLFGWKYAMEMRLRSYGIRGTKGNAYIAILFKETKKDNKFLTNLINAINRVQYYQDTASVDKDNIRITDTFPQSCRQSFATPHAITYNQHYFAYQGSHSTPPCPENVLYLVVSEPCEISTNQLKAFRKQFASKKNAKQPCFMYGNTRPLQPLYGRKISDFGAPCTSVN